MKVQAQVNDTFMGRNGNWVLPFVGSLILLVTPLLTHTLGQESPIPEWVLTLFAALGFGASGVIALFTDTLSAHVVRWLAEVLAVAVLGSLFWSLLHAAA
ncbi:hypothetical protein F2S72_08740 [Pseudomonas syringae pv. actinidiae]|nr:hypothetical protein [Pseudomonas syringae pv. actinidiae]